MPKGGLTARHAIHLHIYHSRFIPEGAAETEKGQ
jgi:hypothetical protein